MPTSFHQLPQVSGARPQAPSFARAMALFAFVVALLWPRITIIAFWAFSDLLGEAYAGWVLPAAGFLVAPWTTMTYALMWGASSDAVSGAEWGVVALAVAADGLTWAAGRAVR